MSSAAARMLRTSAILASALIATSAFADDGPAPSSAGLVLDHPNVDSGSIWQKGSIALGFVAMLAGAGIVLVRMRNGLPLKAATPGRIALVESKRAASLHLVLVRVDGAEVLIASGPSGVTMLRLDARA